MATEIFPSFSKSLPHLAVRNEGFHKGEQPDLNFVSGGLFPSVPFQWFLSARFKLAVRNPYSKRLSETSKKVTVMCRNLASFEDKLDTYLAYSGPGEGGFVPNLAY